MRFEHVALASLAHVVADEVVTSLEIEERLAPVYARFGLSAGRLELMTGIRERRFFARGVRPSDAAARAGEQALARVPALREELGLVVHAAVCRDFLEPATASLVHAKLELSERTLAFDLSNACLGFANALTLAASQIARGDVRAALIVSAEDGRALVESTLAGLAARTDLDRRTLKAAFASLTIGSGAAAAVLTHAELAPDAPRLVASVSRTASQHHGLCHGDHDDALRGPWMETDSEALLVAGNALAAKTFGPFLDDVGWERAAIDRVVTHQVGVAHRKALFETLGLDRSRDFPTVETFGNMGSASLPFSLSLAATTGAIRAGDRVAALGIGSGLQCQMLALRW
ncbi:MAG: 3-oxoacyl-ACP synthase III [Planctomycetes bacterium]|nr:3-oxoacyl-ACP synthase III [Planctomycetota bacterium]